MSADWFLLKGWFAKMKQKVLWNFFLKIFNPSMPKMPVVSKSYDEWSLI